MERMESRQGSRMAFPLWVWSFRACLSNHCWYWVWVGLVTWYGLVGWVHGAAQALWLVLFLFSLVVSIRWYQDR
ncbi:hypothetical protein QBC45DRAFT_147158 [Copromyces sp. CBS 386.78]|nr:hypothetical protein QBC45DRAFT_147158 [Copromyces sp. CBS 386.78]